MQKKSDVPSVSLEEQRRAFVDQGVGPSVAPAPEGVRAAFEAGPFNLEWNRSRAPLGSEECVYESEQGQWSSGSLHSPASLHPGSADVVELADHGWAAYHPGAEAPRIATTLVGLGKGGQVGPRRRE